jgi:predicted dehydrogenase
MTRVALVGLGRWGTNLLRALNDLCDIVYCCNKSDYSAHSLINQRYSHIKCTVDYQEILTDSSVDAVIIATPVGTHGTLAEQALNSGKHVFVEKPLATSSEEAASLVDIANNRGLTLFIGHLYLFHPVFEKIKDITMADPVCHVRMHWAKFGTFKENILWNLVSHDVSLALSLFQSNLCEAHIVSEQPFLTAQDMVTVHLDFGGGRECIIDVNRCALTSNKTAHILTESGTAYLWEGQSLYEVKGDNPPTEIYSNNKEPLIIELRSFFQLIQDETKTDELGQHALEVVRVLESLLKHSHP